VFVIDRDLKRAVVSAVAVHRPSPWNPKSSSAFSSHPVTSDIMPQPAHSA